MARRLHFLQNFLVQKSDTLEQRLGYQFGAILGGAFAPTIAALLWNDYGIIWVSVYIASASLLTLISVLFLTETYQRDLNQDSVE
jgi:fucose permease